MLRFLHAADIHLGYSQYGESERYNDFSRAYLAMVDAAIVNEVDFVLLAGDLFDARDIDPRTLLMDVADAKKRVTKQTKAIIPVHLYGNAVDMPAVLRLAERHGLRVIEDCAQSTGTTLDGQVLVTVTRRTEAVSRPAFSAAVTMAARTVRRFSAMLIFPKVFLFPRVPGGRYASPAKSRHQLVRKGRSRSGSSRGHSIHIAPHFVPTRSHRPL